jgi:pimeloyl-ACP methyl ester carboxylesterase
MMDTMLAAWLIGAVIAILLALLVIVRIARRLERDTTAKTPLHEEIRRAVAKPAAGFTSKSAAAKVIALAAGLHPAHAGPASVDATDAGVKADQKKKANGLAAIAAALAAAAGSIAFASDFLGGKNIDVASIAPVEISAGGLHGTLLSPRKKAPVVLIVPGSGPTDRDGNGPLGVKANSYKLLAEALAKEGIATVRIDKRGMFGSAGDPNAVTVEKYAEDYRSWIDAIRDKTGRRCVWLLGHSEGALMVSVAAQGRKDVCGLILVSGIGRKMGDVLREQLKANPANAPLLDQAFAAVAELEAGRHPDTSAMHPALIPLFAPQVQDFLISVFATDPVEAVRRARKKTLIVQGTADLQITLEDARLLDKAPRTKLRTITGMNHVLKDAPGDRAANLATYADPDLPLAPRLAGVIEDFIEDDD